VASGGAFPSVSLLPIAYLKNHHGQWYNAQFLGRHEPPARVAASFGENWERLVALKKQYDPTGLFRNTFWPLDKDGAQIDPSEHEPPEPEFERGHMDL
jgi:Berberine and berberine like